MTKPKARRAVAKKKGLVGYKGNKPRTGGLPKTHKQKDAQNANMARILKLARNQ
jgi:hypothetical protein